MTTPKDRLSDFNEARLRILAVQLNSIRENYPHKSFWRKFLSRFDKEFVKKGTRDKIRFLKCLAGEAFQRLGKWAVSHRKRPASAEDPATGLRVAAVCNGGMGDLVIYSAFLDRFFRECGFPSIDVVIHPLRVKEAEFVFHDAPAIARMLTYAEADVQPATTPYDVVIKLGDFASYKFVRDDRVRALAPEVFQRLDAARRIQQPYRDFIDVQPALDGLFATVAANSGLRRLDVLGWLGNIPFTQDHHLYISPEPDAYRYLIDDLGLADKPYITIHNGWDNVAHRHADTVTKAWPEEHYVRFVEQFKAKFPHVMVLQVGARTSRPIANVDMCLVNTTSLHEAAWILKHSLLHLDGDSGLVHLARAMHVKSIVLFGPTNHAFFRYAQNDTVSSTVCHNCWWASHHWMRACPRSLSDPECMRSIDPAEVFRLAERWLSALPRWELSACPRSTSRFCGAAVPAAQAGGTPTQAGETPAPQFVLGQALGIEDAHGCDYILDALRSADAPGRKGRKVAVVNGQESLLTRLRAAGHDPAALHLRAEREGQSDPATPPPHRDFGSFYNIPAENEEYGAVVVPSFSGQTAFPRFAVKEFSRILKRDGILVIAGGEVLRKVRAAETADRLPVAEIPRLLCQT